MKIEKILQLNPGTRISVLNQPFIYMGRSEITLDDGSKLFWLYNDDEGMMTVVPTDEELVLFENVDEEIETSETIFFRSKEFEFNYEDAGNVTGIDGESVTEEEDRYLFSDYQSSDGEVLRIISNENTGERGVFFGKTVAEEDVAEI